MLSHLAALGGLLGWLIAILAVDGIHRHVFSLVTASGLTVPSVGVDWRVMLYVLGLGVIVGTIGAVMPALTAAALQPDAAATRLVTCMIRHQCPPTPPTPLTIPTLTAATSSLCRRRSAAR